MSVPRPPRYTKVDGAVTISDRQRTKALELLAKDPTMGTKQALARSGVKGTRGQIGEAIAVDDELREAAIEARGWKVESVENALYRVACDPEHKDFQRCNAFFLKHHGGERYRDAQHVELEHSGQVRFVVESAFPQTVDGTVSEEDDDGDAPALRALPG